MSIGALLDIQDLEQLVLDESWLFDALSWGLNFIWVGDDTSTEVRDAVDIIFNCLPSANVHFIETRGTVAIQVTKKYPEIFYKNTSKVQSCYFKVGVGYLLADLFV